MEAECDFSSFELLFMQDISGSGQGIRIDYNEVHLKQITVNCCRRSAIIMYAL
jgi:hypothetical protein